MGQIVNIGRQEMVRLRRVPSGEGGPSFAAAVRDDLRLQEVQEGFPQGRTGVRGQVFKPSFFVSFILLMPASDEYCPHCDNHFVLDAVTPQAALKVETEDPRVDARYGNGALTLMIGCIICMIGCSRTRESGKTTREASSMSRMLRNGWVRQSSETGCTRRRRLGMTAMSTFIRNSLSFVRYQIPFDVPNCAFL